LDAHVGRRGRIRVKGYLPLTAPAPVPALPPPSGEAGAAAAKGGKDAPPAGSGCIGVEAHGLELRVRNVYTGALLQYFSHHGSCIPDSVAPDIIHQLSAVCNGAGNVDQCACAVRMTTGVEVGQRDLSR